MTPLIITGMLLKGAGAGLIALGLPQLLYAFRFKDTDMPKGNVILTAVGTMLITIGLSF